MLSPNSGNAWSGSTQSGGSDYLESTGFGLKRTDESIYAENIRAQVSYQSSVADNLDHSLPSLAEKRESMMVFNADIADLIKKTNATSMQIPNELGEALLLYELDKPVARTKKQEITKREVLIHYTQIAPMLLPSLAGGYINLPAYTDLTQGERFYPDWMGKQVPVYLKTQANPRTGQPEVFVDSLEALLYLVNRGCYVFPLPQTALVWQLASSNQSLMQEATQLMLQIFSDWGFPDGVSFPRVKTSLKQIGLSGSEPLNSLEVVFPITANTPMLLQHAFVIAVMEQWLARLNDGTAVLLTCSQKELQEILNDDPNQNPNQAHQNAVLIKSTQGLKSQAQAKHTLYCHVVVNHAELGWSDTLYAPYSFLPSPEATVSTPLAVSESGELIRTDSNPVDASLVWDVDFWLEAVDLATVDTGKK